MTLTEFKVPAEVEQKLHTAIELRKELERYEAEAKAELLQAMKQYNIVSIKNDYYTISLAKRTSYSGDLAFIPSEFKKEVLDTTKVGHFVKLTGNLPKNVEAKETEYVTWRVK